MFYNFLDDINNYKNDNMLWGWLAAYPTFIFLGAVLAVFFCAIKFWMKKMPMSDLQVGIVIALPVGILFASFFGKLGIGSTFDWKFWEYFYIWNPGMNLFGGLLGGSAAALLWFSRCAQKRCISLWTYADCIAPNILIAQSIGRWGNLFNHEILGKEVDCNHMSKITWLPDFIWHRLFYFIDPLTGKKMEHIIYHEPLFLYESFGTFILFILLTFLIPNLGRLFSKKPWKNDSKNFPCIFNGKNRWIEYNKLDDIHTQIPIKYVKNKNDPNLIRMSLWQVWNKAYFLQEPDEIEIDVYQKQIEEYKEGWNKYLDAKARIRKKFAQEKFKIEQQFRLDKKKIKNKLNELNFNKKHSFKELEKPAKNRLVFWWKNDSSNLYKVNNPNNYFVIHAGTVSSCYLFFYAILRFILELQRNPYEYSVKLNLALDIVMYTILMLSGLLLFIIAQFVAPKKWREKGWLYEKSY